MTGPASEETSPRDAAGETGLAPPAPRDRAERMIPVRAFVRDESGPTAMEYAIAAAAVAVLVLAAVFALGGKVSAFFQSVSW